MAFSEKEQEILTLLVTISGTLSVFGTVFILSSYAVFREFKVFHLRLIFFLALSDFGSALMTVMGPYARASKNELLCTVSGSMLEYWALSSLFWTCCIAHTLDQVIRKKNDYVEKYESLYHFFCWAVPAVACGYLGFADKIGDAGLWCWIQSGDDVLRFALFYVPVALVLVYIFFTYISISRELSRAKVEIKHRSDVLSDPSREHSIQRTFRYFIVALFVIWLPAVANRAQNFIYPDHPSFWLYCLHGSICPLQGFLDSIIYGMNDELRWKYKVLLQRCCPMVFSNREHRLLLQQEEEEGEEEESEQWKDFQKNRTLYE